MSDTPAPGSLPHEENDAATIPATRDPSSLPQQDGPELPLPEELTALLPHGMYHVEGFLGQGGMGAVYQGMHVRLKRAVAIKIMRRDQGRDHGFEQRFEREAQAMAKLNHPHIVTVHDYGEAGPDYLYIAMELVDGADLMDVIRTGRMTQEMALLLLPQICDALQFAHDHGIVHRDIKPSNIMLTRDGRIKVCDFGLAKRFDAESSFRTQTGTSMGTPDYAAPEQFDPSAPIDHRADIYAMGVMIYQMITGQLPRGVWRPPSQRAEVAPEWDEIVAHAMQSDPADRYQRASEIKTDVSRIGPARSTDIPVRDPTHPPQGGANQHADRNVRATSRAPLLFGLIIGAAVIALGAFFALRPVEDDVRTPSVESEVTSPVEGEVRSPMAAAPPAPAGGAPAPQSGLVTSSSTATKDAPFINTLGMKFVPVPGTDILMCIHETRYKDYAAYAAAVPGVEETWKIQNSDGIGIEQGNPDEHPVKGVSWNDAKAFCEWLSQKEGRIYRLPTDREWSAAVGIAEREDTQADLVSLSDALPGVYPWGSEWPPPQGAGNYADSTMKDKKPLGLIPGYIEGYTDSIAITAPVMNFEPNTVGIHDLGGNLWEWCGDSHPSQPSKKVARGGSFVDGAKEKLHSSYREFAPLDRRARNYGFRIVEGDVRSPPAAGSPVNSDKGLVTSSSTATKDAPFINTLGMKFVPVPITGGPTNGQRVLFSIWETRVQDYEAFVKETKREWKAADFEEGPTHAAGRVSWEDATAFCAWLTAREQKAGRLTDTEAYRLPRDHEWSCAVGIGEREDALASPQTKSRAVADVYPWAGGAWPPPDRVGNYGDYKQQPEDQDAAVLENYQDGHRNAAPVGEYPPNPLGLYDLGGNVWEWCQEGYGYDQHGARVIRGASAFDRAQYMLLSSYRIGRSLDQSHPSFGFRVVLAASAPSEGRAAAPAAAAAVPTATSTANAALAGASALPTPVTATKDNPFINTLGMKFVPVPGTSVLFCIHETRQLDFKVFMAGTAGAPAGEAVVPWPSSAHPQGADFDKAQAFCQWLSSKEKLRYRLPTDREWSYAVGIADKEDPQATPEALDGKVPDVFPWGAHWPPRKGDGNFDDSIVNDGRPKSGPVMQHQPNALGLYDLGGGLWEWVDTKWNAGSKLGTLRGGGYNVADRERLLSSARMVEPANASNALRGFRVVLELGAPAGAVEGEVTSPVEDDVRSPMAASSPVTSDKGLVTSSSTARQKEIEGIMLGTTWRLGEAGALCYFASTGKVAIQSPDGRITTYAERTERDWRVEPDGRVWLHGGADRPARLIALDGTERGTFLTVSPQGQETPAGPATKTANVPALVNALK